MMMNLLEIEDAVKGMSDQQLLREAMNPSGNIPQFLIVSEKQNRDKVRKEYAQNKPQEGTVAQRIMAGDSGIMGAMPQQMAMAPQMPQRMPQMPPPQMPAGHTAGYATTENVWRWSGPHAGGWSRQRQEHYYSGDPRQQPQPHHG